MESFELSFSDWVLALVTIAAGIFLYLTWNFNHFAKNNVNYIKPVPLFGSLSDLILGRKPLVDILKEFYYLDPGSKFTGFFEFGKPLVLLKDPEIIKQVTIKDSDSFLDHTFVGNEDVDPLFGKGLLVLTGQKWRDMRTTLSPTFTGSKIRGMYGFILECAEDLTSYINKKTANGPAVLELKDVFGRVANDIIATSGFGIKVNSFDDNIPEFYTMGKGFTGNIAKQTMKLFGSMSFPSLMKFFKIKVYPEDVSKFFRNVIEETVNTRKQQGIVRPDMIHLLMKSGKASSSGENQNIELTIDEITAQAMIFFLGAFETVSTAMSFAAYELALNPAIQRKLQAEIDEAKKLNETISYEAISSLKYLDMVLSETLRKWPPNSIIDRVCTKPYTFEDGKINLKMKPGQALWIPVYSLHNDPKYFPNPEKFDPERFSDENKHNIKSGTYLPFGSGARICIGARLATIEMKVVLFNLLSQFNLNRCSQTAVPMILGKRSILPISEKGFWLEVEARKFN